MDHADPLTPVCSPLHNAHVPRDSPFSDFFTDEARSSSRRVSYAMPTPEVQHILLRLNDLGAQILRQPPAMDTLDSVSTILDELGRAVTNTASSPMTRHGTNMMDSGFVDDHAEEVLEGSPSKRRLGTHKDAPAVAPGRPQEKTRHMSHDDAYEDVDNDVPCKASQGQQKAFRERSLVQAQAVLERVSRANRDLHQRFNHLRELNEKQVEQVEEAQVRVLKLQSENESLKADLGFDHSELLFLKLQLKALEVQTQDKLGQEHDTLQTGATCLIEDDVDQWKSAWDAIDARQRKRRGNHRVVSRRLCDDEQTPWKLEQTVQSTHVDQDSRSKDEGDSGGAILFADQSWNERPRPQQALTMSRATNIAPVPGSDAAIESDSEDLVSETTSEANSEVASDITGNGSSAVRPEMLSHSKVAPQEETQPLPFMSARQAAWAELMGSLTAFAGMSDR